MRLEVLPATHQRCNANCCASMSAEEPRRRASAPSSWGRGRHVHGAVARTDRHAAVWQIGRRRAIYIFAASGDNADEAYRSVAVDAAGRCGTAGAGRRSVRTSAVATVKRVYGSAGCCLRDRQICHDAKPRVRRTMPACPRVRAVVSFLEASIRNDCSSAGSRPRSSSAAGVSRRVRRIVAAWRSLHGRWPVPEGCALCRWTPPPDSATCVFWAQRRLEPTDTRRDQPRGRGSAAPRDPRRRVSAGRLLGVALAWHDATSARVTQGGPFAPPAGVVVTPGGQTGATETPWTETCWCRRSGRPHGRPAVVVPVVPIVALVGGW